MAAQNLFMLALDFKQPDLTVFGKLSSANRTFLDVGLRWYYEQQTQKYRGKQR